MSRTPSRDARSQTSGQSRLAGWRLGVVEVGVVCALAALILAAQPAVWAAGRIVTFRAAEGPVMSGLLMEAAERPAAAVVLVPMLGRPKEDWQAMAQSFAQANITALAIDLRDHVLPSEAKALESWHADIVAAVGYLVSREDVRPSSIGVLGASLGANLAAVAAARDSRISSLVLISPSLDYRGVRIDAPLRQFGGRPAMLVASRRDPYAARSVRELAASSPDSRHVQWSEMPAHGTQLLARDPDLGRLVVEWFQRTLAVQ